eukprot:TRINITY_DN32020_c0_g2_i2.p1 TRINITY_DN32020_c0_g2~~TRINITY_DN32020_c0_g2_i2.p1  ORF type:complete len:296 (-),score=48.63 TRINITY_DN32020_c0_g2_i2:126-1013(-)
MSVLPYRDVVSDHIRATGRAHCPRRFQDVVLEAVSSAIATSETTTTSAASATASSPTTPPSTSTTATATLQRSVKVVEVGAFLGDCALWAASAFAGVESLAVEPFMESASRIQRSAMPLGKRFHVVSAAAGDETMLGRWRSLSEADVTQHYFTSSGHFAGAGANEWAKCEIQEMAATSAAMHVVPPRLNRPYDLSEEESPATSSCVTFMTLSDIFDLLDWNDVVDVVRVAVIGNEVSVLQGLKSRLQQGHILQLAVECLDLQCDAEGVKEIVSNTAYCVTPSRHDSRWHFLFRRC